jgi:hypothetical protein
MTNEIKLISGGVYQTYFSDTPSRVIAFDDIEVFYDAYWTTIDKWTFSSNLKSKGFYYRTIPRIFLKEVVFIREQPLTTDEFITFRPDLPFRLCRVKQMRWTDEIFPNFNDFKNYAKRFGCDTSNQIILPANKVTLGPFGAKGRITSLKSTLVSSIDDKGFTYIELLWLAHNLQAPHIKTKQENGIGIYRSGHERRVPAYYIGGYYDAANFIPKEDLV